MKQLKFIIAGGGTGGHIFPAIAIANASKRLQPDCDILFVGAKGKMEMEKVPKEGYRIIGLDIAGFNRSSVLKNISLPFKLLKSFFDARKILNEFKPNVVVGVGGYASFPVLYMAQRANIKTLIQEQNSFAGKSNKILGKKAAAVCVAYDRMEKFFPKEVIMLTGNPVRHSISAIQNSRSQGAVFFQLDETKKIVFVFGGSLGARSINEAIADGFKDLITANIQLIWQTGSTYFAKAKEAVKGFESQVKVFDFIYDMNMAYAAADVIVARAGASSIAELCIIGKPVIFVPYPYASEDHQTHNALALVNKNAALMISDANCKQELISKVTTILYDAKMQEVMKASIQTMAILNADTTIAQKLIELATT
jgi:UDP-N-acetylglucosamine--N-acetylmuramyl-(pentapeptide) pyrophosphoryl-undecaprenol N-acetylglucosamine transferase